MIKLYGFKPSFPVNRVRLCLNAMGVEYEHIPVNPLAGETQTEEYLKMSRVFRVDTFTLVWVIRHARPPRLH